jgi:hypothetical protein
MACLSAYSHENLVLHSIPHRRDLLVFPNIQTIFKADDTVETIGYVGRAMSSSESPNWTLGPYLIQTMLLLLAPALLAASVYMLLGRIILVLRAESHAMLKKKWLTKVFVTGDVLSFLLQGTGNSLIYNLVIRLV